MQISCGLNQDACRIKSFQVASDIREAAIAKRLCSSPCRDLHVLERHYANDAGNSKFGYDNLQVCQWNISGNEMQKRVMHMWVFAFESSCDNRETLYRTLLKTVHNFLIEMLIIVQTSGGFWEITKRRKCWEVMEILGWFTSSLFMGFLCGCLRIFE
jgi:hypothetical protein